MEAWLEVAREDGLPVPEARLAQCAAAVDVAQRIALQKPASDRIIIPRGSNRGLLFGFGQFFRTPFTIQLQTLIEAVDDLRMWNFNLPRDRLLPCAT